MSPIENTSTETRSSTIDFGSPPRATMINRLVDPVNGTHRVVIYASGSRGLANFVRPLGLTVFKLGVTSAGDAQRRVVDLRRKQYASLFGRVGQVPEEMQTIAQAEEWALVPLKPEHIRNNGRLPPGFHLRQGVIEAEIRLDVAVESVDQAIHSMMAPRALDRFLRTEEGRARLRQVGLDPDGELHTRYALMFEQDRISRASELYLYRPQAELGRLLQTMATVLSPLMKLENRQEQK